jgi:hypothetical protein
MSEETSLHLYYSIISLASLILFNGEITLLYNYTVFRYARYGIIPTKAPKSVLVFEFYVLRHNRSRLKLWVTKFVTKLIFHVH